MVYLHSAFLERLPTFPLQHHWRDRGHPVVHQAVTLETLRRECLRNVVRSSCFLEIVHVTARALSREALAVRWTHGADLVAGVAIDHGVGADERKAILMFVDVVNGHLPAGVVVAGVALRGVPAPMDVGVAVLALVVCHGEDQVGMAIGTTDFGVQSAQGETGFAMVEFRNGANGFPTLRGVAVLARDIQFSVRTAGFFLGRLPAIGSGARRIVGRVDAKMQNDHQLRQ